MSAYVSPIRAMDEKATSAPWDYSARPNDKPDEAPGSIISGAASGRAVAVTVAPRYSRGEFKADAALLVILRNAAAEIAALDEACEAYRVATDALEGYDPETASDDELNAVQLSIAMSNAYRAMLAAHAALRARLGAK